MQNLISIFVLATFHWKTSVLLFANEISIDSSASLQHRQRHSSSLREFFKLSSANFSHLDIILCHDALESRDKLNEIPRDLKGIFLTIELTTVTRFNLNARKINFALILCESFESFQGHRNKISPELFEPSGYFVIHFLDNSDANIDALFMLMWSKHFYNVNVLVESINSSRMLTFKPFKSEKCYDTSSEIISEFINSSWTSIDFFPDKFQNLHNCTIKASAVESAPNVIKVTFQNGTYALGGLEVVLWRETAKALNIQAHIESSENDFGLIFVDNNTATGNLRHAISGDADLILGSYYLNSLRARYLSHTQVYRLDPTMFVGAQDPEFSPVEKLLRPFNIWLILALQGTLVMGLCCMFFLRKIQWTEEASSMQLLNLFAIFLGVSQSKIPKKAFLSILFISFSFFCMIIRTVYQGSLFRLMQTDDRKRGVTSIDDMVEQGFTFYLSDSFGQTTKDMKFYER